MMYGLHLGANHRIDPATVEAAAARGFTLGRIEVAQVADLSERVAIVASVRTALAPLVIVRGAGQVPGLPLGIDVELDNEPDGRVPAATYAAHARVFIEVCHACRVRPWIGVISNLDDDSLDWLADVVRAVRSLSVGVSVHRYPAGRSWRTPHDGFVSRQAEVDALQGIIGRRPWGVSEVGYHTARQPYPEWWRRWAFPRLSWRWTDEEVGAQMEAEWAFWAQQPDCQFVVAYCLNDDARIPDEPNGRYGYRRADGTWKPVASCQMLARSGAQPHVAS